MINLPKFSNQEKFKTLFKLMNTEYSESLKGVQWEKLSIEKQILLKGESENISSKDLIKFLEIDGLFRINGKPVLLYIRDQSKNIKNLNHYTNSNFVSDYRYHLMCCTTVYDIIVKQKRDRYVYKDYLFEESPKFRVNITDGKKYKELSNVKLQVCQNCINESGIKNLTYLDKSVKQKFLDNFSPKEFCKEHKKSYLKSIVGSSYLRKEIDVYPNEWDKIASDYKNKMNYKCENCHSDLSEFKKYLHVHHMGRKDQNEEKFLKALCVYCHAAVNNTHSFMKSNPQYDVFMKFIKPNLKA